MNVCVNGRNRQSWGGAVWAGVNDGKEMLDWQLLNDAGTNQMLMESWVMQVLQSWRGMDAWKTSLSDFVSISKRIVAVAVEKMQEYLDGSLREMVMSAAMLEGTESQTELKATAAKTWSTLDEQVVFCCVHQSAGVQHLFVWN